MNPKPDPNLSFSSERPRITFDPACEPSEVALPNREALDRDVSKASKPLLFVNFESGGHHHQYVCHLVRLGKGHAHTTARFLLPRKLRDDVVRELSPSEAEFFAARVQILEEDTSWLRVKKLTSRQNLAVWLFVECLNLRERGRSRIMFLHLESVLYPLAFSPLPRFAVSGLMFRPTFHYKREQLFVKGKDPQWLFALKYLLARACANRSGFERIYVMDPLAQEYAASQWHSSKFRLVPDALGPEPGDFRPVAASGPIAERPLTLLIAGALAPRKGIHSLVDALSKTSEATRQSLRVHVVGKPDSTQIDYVAKNLQRLRDLGVQTVDDLRFVDDEELDHCIMRSHIVLTPYVDFKGSSGILIRAAHFGKPVLSTERGLLGRLVLTRKLGQAFDTTNPELFAHHLETIVTTGWVEGFEPEFARRFADDSDPSVFSKVLLSAAD